MPWKYWERQGSIKTYRACRIKQKLGKLVDTVYADAFMKRNGIGVLNIPLDPSRREQYLKRLKKRRELTGS